MNHKDHISSFLLGLSIGGSIAFLFAPRPGRKTRTKIAQAAAEGATYAKEYGETVRNAGRDLVEQGKEEVARQKDAVANAMKRGVEAYQESVR